MELVGQTLVTGVLAGALTAFAPAIEEFERVYWDRGDARKVIRRSMYIDHGSFGDVFGAAVASTDLGGGVGAAPKTLGIWLTDDVCWAIAVVVQHEERRTDEEKQKIYEDCRADASEYYTIYVSAGWQILHTGGIRDNVSTQIDAFRSGQIFLQHRKNKDRFIRPEKIVTPPLYMIHIEDSVGLGAKMAVRPDISNDVLILFPRDDDFVRGQKNIDLELRQGGNKQRLKFKLKTLRANQGRLGNL